MARKKKAEEAKMTVAGGPVCSIPSFVMKAGRVRQALAAVQAVKEQADAEEPGTLFYLVHRALDPKTKKPTRRLIFYECYRDQAAFEQHLSGSKWKALVRGWKKNFEGGPPSATSLGGITTTSLDRIGGFVHLDAVDGSMRLEV